MSHSDGGPAFPYTNCEDHGLSGGYGMFLRDYFAAAALQGALSHPECHIGPTPEGAHILAKLVWQIADVMLKQREAIP